MSPNLSGLILTHMHAGTIKNILLTDERLDKKHHSDYYFANINIPLHFDHFKSQIFRINT